MHFPYSADGLLQWNGTRWVQVAPQPRPRKSVALHVLASLLVSGLGTALAGQWARGLALCLLANGSAAAALLLAAENHSRVTAVMGSGAIDCTGSHCQELLIALPALLLFGSLVWLCGLVDAAMSTRQYNRENGWSD